jgi:hypothetical protein
LDELVDIGGADVARPHRVPIPHDGDTVADREDLAHPVRDVDNGHAVACEPANDIEEGLDFVVREGRRRFVHYQQPRFLFEGTCNFDQLLLGDRELRNRRIRVDLAANLLQEVCRNLPHGVAEDQPAAGRLVAEEYVLGDRQPGDQIELLMDHYQPEPFGLDRVFRRDRSIRKRNAAVVGRVLAAQHLHEG